MSTIDVIITCYNEGAYIEQAVQSVLSQTKADAIQNIVITDDGSQQDTLNVLANIAALDPRIHVHYEKGNGLPGNRNLAIGRYASDLIAILDGDDLWMPEKIERQLQVIEEDESMGLVYTGTLMFDNENPKVKTVVKINDLSKSNDLERDYFLKEGPIFPSTLLIRRNVFERVGCFDKTIKVFEDSEFYSRMAKACKFGYVKEPLVEKRVHAGAITSKRTSVLAHQAYVAFLIASRNPRLVSLLPRRLSLAARKLGNSEIADGNQENALNLYRMAIALRPFSVLAWGSFLALSMGFPLGHIRNWIVTRRKR